MIGQYLPNKTKVVLFIGLNFFHNLNVALASSLAVAVKFGGCPLCPSAPPHGQPDLSSIGGVWSVPRPFLAETSHSLPDPVQGPLFGGLYQTDQGQKKRLCLIP
jgi:hypothetical protein